MNQDDDITIDQGQMDRIIILAQQPGKKRTPAEQKLVEQYIETKKRLEYQKKDLPAFMKYQGGGKSEEEKKPETPKGEEADMYLDADEDHLDGKDKMSEIIHTRNIQKIRFL